MSSSYFIRNQNETAVFYQDVDRVRPLPGINTVSLMQTISMSLPQRKPEQPQQQQQTGNTTSTETVINKESVDALDSFNIFDYGMDELIEVAYVIFQRMPKVASSSSSTSSNNAQPSIAAMKAQMFAFACGNRDVELLQFLKTVRANYFDTVPFHNFRHAVNVLQTLHCFFINLKRSLSPDLFASLFCDRDIFLTYVAAICHDLQHPGVDNNLLTQLNDPLAIRYNYNAILEQHHCSCCFAVLENLKQWQGRNEQAPPPSSKQTSISLFERFCGTKTQEDERECYKLLAILIGATEVPRHHVVKANIDKAVTTLQQQTITAPPPPPSEMEKRDLLCALLEAADISNEVRSNFEGINKRWSVRVQAEFLKSGDILRRAGKPVMDPQNREKLDIGAGQQFFTNFMCTPLYVSLNNYFTIGRKQPVTIFEACLRNFKINCEQNWAKVSKEESRRMMQQEEARIDEEIRRHYYQQQQQQQQHNQNPTSAGTVRSRGM